MYRLPEQLLKDLPAAVNLSKIALHPFQLSSAPIPVGCGVGAILLAGLAYLCIKYSGHRLVPQKEYGSAAGALRQI